MQDLGIQHLSKKEINFYLNLLLFIYVYVCFCIWNIYSTSLFFL